MAKRNERHKRQANCPQGRTAKTKTQIKIRLADSIDDLELLRPLSLEVHAESRFSEIPFNHKKRDKLLSNAIDKPDQYAILIAEYKGEPIGYLSCSIGEYLVGDRDLITGVNAFYIVKKYHNSFIGGKAAVRLLNGVVKWSEVRNVKEITLYITSGINLHQTDKFIRRFGFGIIGANYALQLA